MTYAPASEFTPGDHLRVRRHNLYFHHGIYVGTGQVVEFGGGPREAMSQSVIREVSLSAFARSGTPEVVPHPHQFLCGFAMGVGEARSSDEIVADAKRLVGSTTARYNVFGANCEHFANWSATGRYFESLQVRRYFCARAALGVGLMFATIRFGATPWMICLTLLLTVTGFVSQVLYRPTPAYLRGL